MISPVLIDVSGVVCRGYFAEESLSQREGREFLPAHQLVNMVASLVRQFEMQVGDPAAAVLDPRGRTWRHHPATGGSWDYKAKRKPKPAALSRLLDDAPRIFASLGWPIVAVDGYEADDVLCSLAHRTRRAIVVSADKDFQQFLGARAGLPYGSVPDLEEGCRIWNPTLARPDLEPGADGSVPSGGWLTWEHPWDKFAIDLRKEPATKIIEIQALMGDSVDGIPGAKGIGEKAAKLLIQEYGTAEGAIRAAEAGPLPSHLPQHRANRKRLLESAADIRMSWRLARLVPDLDVQPGRMRPADDGALRQVLAGWERGSAENVGVVHV